MITVEKTEDRGRIVVAAQNLVPGVTGTEVLAEVALVVFPKFGSPKDCSPPLPTGFPSNFSPQLWSDYWYYKSQPETVKAKVRGFYAELDGKLANSIRVGVSSFRGYENIVVEEFVLVNMVINFNAVILNPAPADGSTGKGTNFGGGLFEISCCMSHSCKPNCCWISSQDGSMKIVRIVTSVQKGEELTINYLDGKGLLLPTHARRKMLRQSKMFDCRCKRCNSNYDDTRRFHCTTNMCPGVHFVQQMEEEDTPMVLACTVCSNEVTVDVSKSLLKQESELKSEIYRIEYTIDHGLQIDVTDRIKKLRPFHPFHYLSEACFEIQGELYLQLGDFRSAARVNNFMVACLDEILGEDYHDRSLAFACERVGDSLKNVDLKNAERNYQRTVRVLQITDGFSQPYSKAAMDKLFSIQRRLSNEENEKDQCALCGAVSRKSCSCCGRVVYCSRDHQVIHWKKVHKKQCKPKAPQT